MTWNPLKQEWLRVPARVGTRTSLNRNFGDSPYWLSDRTSTKKLCFFIAVHRARFYFDVSTDDRGMCSYDGRWWLLCVLIRGVFPRRDIKGFVWPPQLILLTTAPRPPLLGCPRREAFSPSQPFPSSSLAALHLTGKSLWPFLCFFARASGRAAEGAGSIGFSRGGFGNLALGFFSGCGGWGDAGGMRTCINAL